MEKKELIGRKVVGFIFDPQQYPKVPYRHENTLECADLIGDIVRHDVEEDWYLVHFPGTKYGVHYPASLIVNYLVEEPKGELKVGDLVRGFETVPKSLEFCRKYIGYIGEVVRIESDINIVHIKFHDGEVIPYPLDQALEHRAGNNDTTYTVSDLKFDYGFYKNENKATISIEEKHKYLVEKGYGLKDYLSDLDNLIETGWFKAGSIKECVSYHKDYDMHDFIQKGREYLRQMLVGNEHELPNKSSNIDNGFYKNENKAELNSFCETPEVKCTMNYCNDNGCKNRKRILVDPIKEPKSDDPLDNLPLIGDGVLMEGSDDGEDWCVQNIIGKLKDGRYISFDVNGFSSWQYCRPMPKTKITRKEFESKFEIID